MKKNSKRKGVASLEGQHETPEVYTVEDVQKILKIGRSLAYRFVNEAYQNNGPFRVIRIGEKNFRITKNSFDAWMNRT